MHFSSKKGPVEVVLGVPDPVSDERSESEGSESDREEHTADRIAEKLGLTQFLRRRKRGGRGRDRGHSKSEAVEVAVQAPEAQQDSLLVSSLCRWCHGAAVLALGRSPLCRCNPSLFRFLSFLLLGHPWLGGPLQGAAGMPDLAGALCFAAWLR